MARLRVSTFAVAAVLALSTAELSTASPVDIMIGDDDGFGYGASVVPDGSPLLDNITPVSPVVDALAKADRRSAAEKAASNGAQQTDLYSAIKDFSPILPMPEAFSLVFPFIGDLTTGVFTLDMGGFEASLFRQINVSFNGVAQPNLFNFTDGQFGTAVRSFTLDATALANATLAQQFVVNITRGTSFDGVAFDYFRFTGDVETLPAPEPATLLMLGTGLSALAMRRRRKA